MSRESPGVLLFAWGRSVLVGINPKVGPGHSVMHLFGMAGLAEAGLAFGWGLMCIGLFVTTLVVFLGLVLRSRIASVTGGVVWGLTTLLFLPWRAFWFAPSDDPDVQSFQAAFRQLAWWWLIVSAMAVAAAVLAFGLPAKPVIPADPQGAPDQSRGGTQTSQSRRIAWAVALFLGALLMMLVMMQSR